MHILELYSDISRHNELRSLLTLGAQKHPAGLAANFLEKDIWVTEILHILYDEKLMGDFAIAFKGGTALSKCWNVIERFSEDIDLSIHWADLAGTPDEATAWEESIQSGNQRNKFRKQQKKLLIEWSVNLVNLLNKQFTEYGIDGLSAELEPDSNGEKIDIHFPRLTSNDNAYQLDHILLEFGGRNRGRPTQVQSIACYLGDIPEMSEITFPTALVQAYDPEYILWEKLTALHQFSTQTREPNPIRLSRHWYDVDCLLKNKFANHLISEQAMSDVVEMKVQRWEEKGVDFATVLDGNLQLIPSDVRLQKIAKDHIIAINGRMFFSTPDKFENIIKRLKIAQEQFNCSRK